MRMRLIVQWWSGGWYAFELIDCNPYLFNIDWVELR